MISSMYLISSPSADHGQNQGKGREKKTADLAKIMTSQV